MKLQRLLLPLLIAASFGVEAQTLVPPLFGGTGVRNADTETITLGGALSTAGGSLALTLGGATAVTLPTSGTLAILGANTFTGVQTLSAQPILSTLTASLPVFTDASKGLVSNAMTGTGNVVMSADQTLTGTLTAAIANFSGLLTANAGITVPTAKAVTLEGTTTLSVGGLTTATGQVAVGTATSIDLTDFNSNYKFVDVRGITGGGIEFGATATRYGYIFGQSGIFGIAGNNAAPIIFYTGSGTGGTIVERARIADTALTLAANINLTGSGTGAISGFNGVSSTGPIASTYAGLLPISASASYASSYFMKIENTSTSGSAYVGYQWKHGNDASVWQIAEASTGTTNIGVSGVGDFISITKTGAVSTNGGSLTAGDITGSGTTINFVTSGTTLTVGVGADNGTVSAGVFTDRTKAFDGDALAEIGKIKNKNGHIDHDSLPAFARANVKKATFDADGKVTGETVEVERDLGAMISMHSTALQQVSARIKAIEARLP